MRFVRVTGFLIAGLFVAAVSFAADPETKLTVEVKSATTGKPIERASVIVRFRPGATKIKMNKVRTSWETKTNLQGSVSIPSIPMGAIGIQVIAQNFQTFGDIFQLTQPEQTVTIKLNPPQAQYSEDAKTKEVK